MVISMHLIGIDMYKYILGDLKLVWGLRVNNVPKMSTFIVILTKMKHIFLYVTTSIYMV